MLLIYSNYTTVQVSDRIYKGALVNRMCYCNTPFFNPQNNTHRDVYKYTPFHVLPEHTLVSFLTNASYSNSSSESKNKDSLLAESSMFKIIGVKFILSTK